MPITRLLPILALVIAAASVTVAVGYAVSGANPAPPAAIGAAAMVLALAARLWGRRP